ncbi:YibE/F family protein [Fusibacter sp. 3D3]|uniref:YibE/F family protein n=1 Tax=Fusibacter sp. 3D3 TaxID=1048380 RepID=UPI000857C288|nr:YibE/F family protein [Fusibacter sp. 3D3]GAU78375.1 integral membrane protein [Fusibacter sp. 3D3]
MKKLQYAYMYKIIPLVMTALILCAAIYLLNTPAKGEIPTAASKLIFEKAHVSKLLTENASPDYWTEGLRLGTQEVIVTIDSGDYEGEELHVTNYLNAYANVDLKESTRIVVRLDVDEQNNPYIVYIANYDRSIVLIALALLFAILLILLGGKKGISALFGLLFTILSIWFLLIPLIQRGVPSILASILIVAITTVVSLFLLNGFSLKTFCATLGCIGGVTIAGLMAYMTGIMTPINGFNMMEAEELILRASDSGLKISGLLVSGILIASLGAVMDIALTITSAVSELHDMNPKASRKVLFKSSLNIGRDAMGTMANTLILAFAGASLNTLILFRVFDYPYLQIFNSDMIAVEIIQGLAGSIGIILTVPFVAALSAMMYAKAEK